MLLINDIQLTIRSIADRFDRNQIVAVVAQSVAPQWQEMNFPFPMLTLEDGETNKSLATVERIWDFLLTHAITRRGLLIAVGGGSVTDMAGFAAATYKRGIRYMNVPTTLLAMVDASTGGKTGFNYGGIKNAIGAFHTPVWTPIWPKWLESLPANELLSGYAEMLKTGLIGSASLWNRLLQYDLETFDTEPLKPLITDCVAIKEQIVAADPQETELRKVLNFGHTFGHALEEMSLTAQRSNSAAVQQQSGLLHGFAVLYGLIAELYLSVTLLGCPRKPLQQLTQLMLRYYGRPECKCSNRQQLIELMRQDKKNEHAGEINCTLLKDVGSPVCNRSVSSFQASEALDYLFSL